MYNEQYRLSSSSLSSSFSFTFNYNTIVHHGSLINIIITVDGVSKVLGHAAEKVAPHVKKQGAKLVPESLKNRKEGEPSNWDGTKHVASSSVQGWYQITEVILSKRLCYA